MTIGQEGANLEREPLGRLLGYSEPKMSLE